MVLEAHANLRQFFESMARDHRRLHCQPLHTQLLCYVLKVLARSALPGSRHHSKQEQARAHFRRNALCFFHGLLSHRRPIQRYEDGMVGNRASRRVPFSPRTEQEHRRRHLVEYLRSDTAEPPAISTTQTMRCHGVQRDIMVMMRIRDDLCCWISSNTSVCTRIPTSSFSPSATVP